MSAFKHKHNSDDVYFRALIVGVLNFFMEKLYIWTIEDETGVKVQHNVPFFYNAAGDERFMQDIFLQHTLNDCYNEKVTDANTDVIPRGHITLESSTIIASSMTNRFVRGTFTEEEADGTLKTYNAPINQIPLEMSFTVEMVSDTIISSFKLIEKIISTFYKAHAFRFIYKGHILEGMIAFPEDVNMENTHEFSFGDDTSKKINFSVAVESTFPVIDETRKFLESSRLHVMDTTIQPKALPETYDRDGQVMKSNEVKDVLKGIPGISDPGFANGSEPDKIPLYRTEDEAKEYAEVNSTDQDREIQEEIIAVNAQIVTKLTAEREELEKQIYYEPKFIEDANILIPPPTNKLED